MIVLDTQHFSQHQASGSRDRVVLDSKLAANSDCWITVITPFEQLKEVLGKINSHSARPEKQLAFYALLHALLTYYAEQWRGRILPFDQRALDVDQSFDARLIRRIGDRNARIGAIALVHGATVVTSNRPDFQSVPGLRVEDWLSSQEGES